MKNINRVIEDVSVKFYQFALNKHRACIYVHSDDTTFLNKISEYDGSLINSRLAITNIFFQNEISLDELKKHYDCILILDINCLSNKQTLKFKIIDEKTAKLTYFIPNEKITHNDIHIKIIPLPLYDIVFKEYNQKIYPIYELKQQFKYLNQNEECFSPSDVYQCENEKNIL